MGKYLKMADVFVGEYKPKRRIDAWPPSKYGETLIELSGSPAQYAVHAINSHDELVAENERLREFERDAMRYRFLLDNCTTQQADSHGPVFVMTIRQKDNLFNVGLLIDEAMKTSR